MRSNRLNRLRHIYSFQFTETMQTERVEIRKLVNHFYNSQISGFSREDVIASVKQCDNKIENLLVEAILVMVEDRNNCGRG